MPLLICGTVPDPNHPLDSPFAPLRHLPELDDGPPPLKLAAFTAPSQRSLFILLGLMLLLICGALAGAALLFNSYLADTPDGFFGTRRSIPSSNYAALPPLDIPKVEPVKYLDVPRDKARNLNAAVPFSTAPNPAATPLRFKQDTPDFARAVDCLAAAAWYEAGDDPVGQQAVVQVVLNRMRHPAFPKSVCGVVFQGSERKTGCQFSFTCDGAMRRTPSVAAWQRAQSAGYAGLSGLVFSPVGYATHYHTDWVVPYWSASVEKITAVRTHLFFRWRGANGTPAAFKAAYSGTETIVPAMARLSVAHRNADGTLPIDPAALADAADAYRAYGSPVTNNATGTAMNVGKVSTNLRGNSLKAAYPANNIFVIQIANDMFSGTLAIVALDLCRQQPRAACSVIGFFDTSARIDLGPLARPTASAPMDFYYHRNSTLSKEIAYWNCSRLPRPNKQQCIPTGFTPIG